MNTPPGSSDASRCPMHRIAEVSGTIMRDCMAIFGPPTLKNQNLLGGLEGDIFAVFIENFSHHRIQHIEIIEPEKMVEAQLIGMEYIDSFFVDMFRKFESQTTGKQMTRLAYMMYTKFVKENISRVGGEGIEKVMNMLHLTGFSLTFFQAFDSVLLTGAGYVKTLKDWEEIKRSMKLILVNLARIPTNNQEGLTSSSQRVGYMFGREHPYMIGQLEELWALFKKSGPRAYSKSLEKIRDDGGYGVCPALQDGVFESSFNALFHIYGAVFVKPKESK